MSQSATRVPHQAGRMADLMTSTGPQPAITPGRHRAARPPLDVHLLLLTTSLGAVLAAGIFTIGGPW